MLGGLLVLSVMLAGCAGTTSHKTSATSTPTAAANPTAVATPRPSTIYVGAGETISALDVHTGAVRWAYNTGVTPVPVEGVGALTVAGDELLFLDGGDYSLSALSRTTGTLLWKAGSVQSATGGGYIVVADGVAVATSHAVQVANTTTAVDLQSGKVLWTQPTGATQLLAGRGMIYKARVLPGGDAEPVTNGYIQALKPTTGTVLWQADGHDYSFMSLAGNSLIATDSLGLVSFNAQTGTQEWSQALPGLSTVEQDGKVFYLGDGHHLYAFDTSTHSILWQTPVADYGALYQNGLICASGSDQVLYGFDAATGAQLWHASSAEGYTGLLADSGLCIADSYYGQVTTAPLTAIDARTGAIRWTANMTDIQGQRLVSGGNVFVISGGGHSGQNTTLNALSEADGSKTWQFDTGGAQQGSIALGS